MEFTLNNNLENDLLDIVKIKPDDALILEILTNLNEKGFYCLKNSIDTNRLNKLNIELADIINKKGKRYFSIVNICNNIESIFNIFEKSEYLKIYLRKLAGKNNFKKLNNSDTLNVLRVVTGENSDRQSFRFHYDAFIITALIPLIIPSGTIDNTGHLISFKNSRNIRKYVLFNLLEKILIQNYFSQKIISIFVKRNLIHYLNIIEPGNIYFFYGYRTLHANLPVNKDFIRATMLYHFGNPHEKSFFMENLKRFRHFKERINLNK